MTFLPFENITYKTKLGEDEVLRRLHDLTVPTDKLRFQLSGQNASKPYSGDINGGQFTIKRIIKYVNSWLPVIHGTVTRDTGGTIINVKMKLSTWVTVLSFIWIAFMSVGSFLSLTPGTFYQFYTDFDYSYGKHLEKFAHWLPVGLIMFWYIMTMGAFKYESRKSKKDLQNIFVSETP